MIHQLLHDENGLHHTIGAEYLRSLFKQVPERESVIIPQISIIPTELFQFQRFRFAVTNNKVEEKTLQVAWLHLEKLCSSYVQVYVICLRESNARNIHIFSPKGRTYNIEDKIAF